MKLLEKEWAVELINWAKEYNIEDILDICSDRLYKNKEHALLDLYSLNLENKNIHTLPNSIVNLTNLKYLYLSDNDITIFPSMIFELTQLLYLDISNNRLTEVSLEITRLTSLKYLNISNNNIMPIPKYLHFSDLTNFAWNEDDILSKIND